MLSRPPRPRSSPCARPAPASASYPQTSDRPPVCSSTRNALRRSTQPTVLRVSPVLPCCLGHRDRDRRLVHVQPPLARRTLRHRTGLPYVALRGTLSGAPRNLRFCGCHRSFHVV